MTAASSRRSGRNRPLRASDFPALAETFLVAGVAAVLGIRAFLTAAGFPQIGGAGLHIAHLLWGGALMLAGILLLIAYVDRRVEHLAVVLAGLGFGAFIDEVGKFVTSDNDYFFRPAVALIYIVFVGLFLVARALAGTRALTEREALANALAQLAGSLGKGLDRDDATRIRHLLTAAGSSRLVSDLRAVVDRTAAPNDDELVDRAAGFARAAYERLVGDRRFELGVLLAVAVYAVVAVLTGILATTRAGSVPSAGLDLPTASQAVSSIVGAALVLRGALLIRTERLQAYRWLARGLLVWILVTQVFLFYTSQLAGIGGLAFDLGAYVTVRYAIGRERLAAATAPGPSGA
ncbi:MAG TPA: hypothetical protein VET90_00290 [Candidatus Binatus sp.]|nr:hypothetical protein [Candidatus Binatus sp.]